MVDRLPTRTVAPHGVTGPELERLSGAGHMMQKHLIKSGFGDLWYLTTDKGLSRDKIAEIQKRISRLQRDGGFYGYSAWIFETRPKLHARFVFIGDTTIIKKLRRSALGPMITIKPVYDLGGLLRKYHAKERTPQAGYGRERPYGGRIEGSHRLEGGGDRVHLSRELERDAIEAGLVEPWIHANAKRKADRKEYRKRPLTARATKLSGQILLFLDMKPVARLQAFGGCLVPPAVAAEIEFRRKQRGLSQRQLGATIGVSQEQLANAIRGHDPISAVVVNRLREVLLDQRPA